MKIAVMGDIHSNHTALATCIAHALERDVDEFIFLGDYISDCAYPQKTMQIIYDMKRKYTCQFIRGNREDYMLHHRKDPHEIWTYSSTSGSLLYTYENLFEADLDFFESLAISGFYEIEGFPSFCYCHGSPASSREYLSGDKGKLDRILKNLDVDLLIGAHTHMQESFTVGNKKWVNPGSVGIPIGHGGKSQYMILHGTKNGWREEFFQLAYDVDAAVRELETSGLDQKAPWWTKLNIHLLYTGEDLAAPCIRLARRLWEEAGEEVNGLDIPEKYMEMAVKELGGIL